MCNLFRRRMPPAESTEQVLFRRRMPAVCLPRSNLPQVSALRDKTAGVFRRETCEEICCPVQPHEGEASIRTRPPNMGATETSSEASLLDDPPLN